MCIRDRHFIPFEGIKFITLRTTLSMMACAMLYGIMMICTKDEIVLSLFKRIKNEKNN